MKQARFGLSLSGLPSSLTAIGGSNEESLKASEKYSVRKNKWEELPSLSTPWEWAGTVLLSSLRIFCFCGRNYDDILLNSIESLEAERDLEWKTLPLDDRVAQADDMAAAEFKGKIVVFGWTRDTTSSFTQILSTEGNFIDELNDDASPEYKRNTSFVFHSKKIHVLNTNYA